MVVYHWVEDPGYLRGHYQPMPPDLIIYYSIKFAQLDSNPSVRWCRAHYEPLESKS